MGEGRSFSFFYVGVPRILDANRPMVGVLERLYLHLTIPFPRLRVLFDPEKAGKAGRPFSCPHPLDWKYYCRGVDEFFIIESAKQELLARQWPCFVDPPRVSGSFRRCLSAKKMKKRKEKEKEKKKRKKLG